MRPVCRHCRDPIPGRSPGRGLCWKDYRKPGVRAQYRRLKPGPNPDGSEIPDADGREPTAEEVERTVAEQMECLPAWWDEETERERAKDWVRKVWVLVKCA